MLSILLTNAGTAIYAVAQGEIIKVVTTYSTSRWANRGAGAILKFYIQMAQLLITAMCSSFVSQGDRISECQIIALMEGQTWDSGRWQLYGLSCPL